MDSIKLTITERLMLTNQFRILEILDSENAESHRKIKEILVEGFAGEYDQVFRAINSDELSLLDCQEIKDIMRMYQRIERSYTRLSLEEQKELDEIGLQIHTRAKR